MMGSPLRKGKQCRPQRLPIGRETVFSVGLRTRQYTSLNDRVSFELPELLSQNLLAGSGHASFEFLETQYTIL